MSRFPDFTKFVVVPLLMVLVASASSNAQDQEKRQRRSSQRRGGSRSSSTALLRISEVQAELKLTDEQKEELKSMPRLDLASLRDLAREERSKKTAEYRTKSNAKIKEILKEEQQKRLNQLVLQRQGYRALGTAAVAKELGLSKEQEEKIQTTLNPSRDGQTRTSFQNLSDEERQKLIAQMRERSEKREKAALAVLTDEQGEKFEKMKGKKFEFPSRRRRTQ